MIDPDRMPILNDKSKFDTFSGSLLGVFSHPNISADNIFFNTPALYLYDDHTTRFTEYWYIHSLIIPILQGLGFSNIQTEKKIAVGVGSARVDIIALNRGIQYVFEIKAYRSAITNQKIIQNAIYQIQSYKNALRSAGKPKQCFGLILLCRVDKEMKKMLWEREHIFLWDIENLLYLCNSDPELLNTLSKTIPYSLGEFSPEVPFGLPLEIPEYSQVEETLPNYHNLIERLTSCKQGKGNSAEYEKICAEIIKYLFETEFSQFSEQHKTQDAMFRMDILCALKGTTAFWQMLTHYYNTKFVVIEFKNYTKKIQQNLIYVTDKYLFNPALRNVAFIISRNGFDKHAHDAAMGILKESGKLIVDLTDDDLIKMIIAKTKGEEPSDYLLNKLELLLMSVSV